MDEQRKGEIALAIYRARARDEGIRIIPKAIKRALGDISKQTGISKEELKEFSKEEAEALLKETFKE